MVSVSSPGSGVIGAIGIGWYGAGGLAADGLAAGAATPGTTFRNRLPISFSPATPAAAAVTAVPAAATTNLRLLMTVIGSSAVLRCKRVAAQRPEPTRGPATAALSLPRRHRPPTG